MTLPSIVARFERGDCSAQVALMDLLTACEDILLVERAVANQPALRVLLREQRSGCERLIEGLRAEPERGDDVLAYQRALFDGWVAHSEEASVAFYSLGSPELLAKATQEVVGFLTPLFDARTRVLDLGCGIGRIALALAPAVAAVDAIDLSPGMVEVARRRCAAFANVRVQLTDGQALGFADGAFDLVLAVDSFPYIVEAGLLTQTLDEAARVLVPGGALVILNFSYNDQPLPSHPAFVLELSAQPFTLWNGHAFVLRRS
jgi:SAM-dependent methyltransferase